VKKFEVQDHFEIKPHTPPATNEKYARKKA
jgi:hypothetical protein